MSDRALLENYSFLFLFIGHNEFEFVFAIIEDGFGERAHTNRPAAFRALAEFCIFIFQQTFSGLLAFSHFGASDLADILVNLGMLYAFLFIDEPDS